MKLGSSKRDEGTIAEWDVRLTLKIVGDESSTNYRHSIGDTEPNQ